MSRMGREFSLVLLGSGILTAGYFLAPTNEDALMAKADGQAAERVGDKTYRSSGYHSHMPLIFLHSPGYAGSYSGRPGVHSSPGVTRGGIGGIGRSAGASGS
ncbi:hypothetical protein BH11PLA2_BH11PLA2_14650 [soil metagenome]